MIRAEKLTKIFGAGELSFTALSEVDLTILEKEFVAIIGPSGAGKSTLLYQLSLLDDPTSGEIYLDNLATSNLSQSEKTLKRLNELGYIFQDYALLPELTALENVALPLLMQGLSRVDANDKALEGLARVGLKEKAKNLPSQLSGGQQQRVSIARAIAHNPKIIFADEPTANLDTKTSTEVLKVFMELHQQGQTIIMVTHEQEFAHVAQRIIEMKDGKILSDKRK
jgi:putative ABC transport system ATP-binding protein